MKIYTSQNFMTIIFVCVFNQYSHAMALIYFSSNLSSQKKLWNCFVCNVSLHGIFRHKKLEYFRFMIQTTYIPKSTWYFHTRL
jgi:hypothetical protein